METVFFVGSATYAARGKRVLERSGIRSDIRRVRDREGTVGCGYTIIVQGGADRAAALLKAAGVPLRGIESGKHS